jgi:hypothetical protein
MLKIHQYVIHHIFAHAIKIPGLRLSDLLDEHADELRELDEDCDCDVEAEVRCTAA